MTIPQPSTAEPLAGKQESAEAQEGTGNGTERQEVAVQALCSICQCPIDDGEEVLHCPECHLPFHAECWQENMGCSTYGCPQVSILKKGPDLNIDNLPGGGQQVWHYTVGNQFYGPAFALQLATWAREKRITAATMVWKAGMADWLPIASLPGLVSVVDPGYAAGPSDAASPWEFVLLAASAVGLILSLVAYGIPSLLVMIGIGVFGAMRFHSAGRLPCHWNCVVILVIAFVVSQVGFWAGLILGVKPP